MPDLGTLMWFVTAASLIGTISNIFKRWWCFVIWLGTNAAWAFYDFHIGAFAQSALGAVYVGLAVAGIIKWRLT